MVLGKTSWSTASVSMLFGILAATEALGAAAKLEPVDLELVLATDTSQSIDDSEAMLQREGVAAAFRSPEIARAIQAGALGKIGVLYLDWSGAGNDRIVVNWWVIHDRPSADAFSAALLKAPRTYGSGTAIGEAITLAAGLIEANNLEGTQKTIDVSGDGPNNQGRAVAEARDEVAAKGITINGLPIVTDEYGGGEWGAYYGELDKYYANCVIGGPRSFALPAKGFQDFATAIRRKLVLELSDAAQPPRGAPSPIVKVAAVPTPQLQRPLRPDAGVNAQQARLNCGGGGPTRGRGFRGFGGFR